MRSPQTTSGGRRPAPVLLGVEQLRRSVPGGIGTAAAGLLQGLSALSPKIRSGLVLYASAPAVAKSATPGDDPLASYDLPILASALPPWLLTRLWARGLAAPGRSFSLLHATSFQYPPVRAPLVSTVHDLGWRHVPEAYGSHGRHWHEGALRRIGRDAAGFVVPSAEVADDLAASGIAIGSRPVEVIPWGSDHLEPPDFDGATRLLASLAVDRPFLLSVSTVEPRKNLARLVEAYGAARAALDDPPLLLIVGPAGWGGGIAPTDGVVLAGHVGAAVLSALYRSALGFVYVPLHEGYGLPVLEAMAAGAPVLSSAVPSSSGATLLVEATGTDTIRDGLISLTTDEGLRDELIVRGSAVAATRSWGQVALRHVELWRRLGAELPL